jgi:hypothetical protein
MENFESMGRKDLQALAKLHGIKANLSNADIIVKLREKLSPVQASAEESVAVPEAPICQPVPSEDLLPAQGEGVENTVAEGLNSTVSKEHVVGDMVEAFVNAAWQSSVIKRINKKTIRVSLSADAAEYTVKFEEVRTRTAAVAEASMAATDDEMEDVTKPAEDSACDGLVEAVATQTPEESINILPAEVATNQEQLNQTTEVPLTVEAEVAQPTASLDMCSEAMEVSGEEGVVVLEQGQSMDAPPTPVSVASNSAGWGSTAKFSLQGCEPMSVEHDAKRRERRNARRSAMEKLAEDMKHEIKDAPGADSDNGSPLSAAIEEAAEPVALAPTPVKEEISALVVAPAEEVTVAVAPAIAVAPVASAAAATHAPLPIPAATSAAKGEVLPRMNKAQAMRLDAIQKKIVTTESAPAAPTAFTISAKAPSAAPTPLGATIRPTGHTPSYRSSICTSAPSSSLHGAMRAKPLHTPLGSTGPSPAVPNSRLSIQVSGTKRKVSESAERDRSSISTAPDFKRMHSKQFSALKSIAECVDQVRQPSV